MVQFFLEIIIFGSFAFLVYLVSLTVPRISDEEINALKEKRKEKLLIFIEKSDLILKSFLEKILRKVKIWLLSLNNFIESKLSKFKKDIQRKELKEEIKEEKSGGGGGIDSKS